MTNTISPSFMANETSLTARRPPKRFETLPSSRIAATSTSSFGFDGGRGCCSGGRRRLGLLGFFPRDPLNPPQFPPQKPNTDPQQQPLDPKTTFLQLFIGTHRM